MTILVEAFPHSVFHSISYVVYCSQTLKAAIIDPVLDFQLGECIIGHQHADSIIHFVDSHHLDVEWVVETHCHDNRVSAGHYLMQRLGAKTVISSKITTTQKQLVERYGFSINTHGEQFGKLVKHHDELPLGNHTITIIEAPGHSIDSIFVKIGEHLFVGDTLLMPDLGIAHISSLNGCARSLHHTLSTFVGFEEDCQVYVSHDYQPQQRAVCYHSTVKAQKTYNIAIKKGISEHSLVAFLQRQQHVNSPFYFIALQINAAGACLPRNQQGGLTLTLPFKAY